MRIWDVSPKKLCRHHLLGEHRELHAIWSVLVNGKMGYARHPETLRWRGPTPGFAAWTEKMKAPRLLERCDRVKLRHAALQE